MISLVNSPLHLFPSQLTLDIIFSIIEFAQVFKSHKVMQKRMHICCPIKIKELISRRKLNRQTGVKEETAARNVCGCGWEDYNRKEDLQMYNCIVYIVYQQNKNKFLSSVHCSALCVLCSVGSSVLKNALYLIQSDRLSLSIIYRAIHFDQWDSSVSTTVSNSELSDCSVSTTELSDRSCIWYWVAFGRKFQF